jgi:small-conductance mechanosensitive channel
MDWNRTLLGNSLILWMQSIALAFLLWSVFWLTKKLITRYLGKVAEQKHNHVYETFSQLTQRTNLLFLAVIALSIAVRPLSVPQGVHRAFDRTLIIALVLQFALWGSSFLQLWIEPYLTRSLGLSTGAESKVAVVTLLIRLVFFSLLGIWGLDNLGVNVSSLVAGLGVGGIAVALATQNILSDLFASLSITLDKPFQIGDYIRVDTLEGTIERIGLKTTRIRSIGGEQLIFSNTDLLASRISNLRRMEQRRVQTRIGVVYDTTPEKLQQIPKLIQSAIESASTVQFDRAFFVAFGPSSLDFEFVYWVKDPEFRVHLEAQQKILLHILNAFRSEKIEFAFPTQSVLITSLDAAQGQPKQ